MADHLYRGPPWQGLEEATDGRSHPAPTELRNVRHQAKLRLGRVL
jgi:hypothetical protein